MEQQGLYTKAIRAIEFLDWLVAQDGQIVPRFVETSMGKRSFSSPDHSAIITQLSQVIAEFPETLVTKAAFHYVERQANAAIIYMYQCTDGVVGRFFQSDGTNPLQQAREMSEGDIAIVSRVKSRFELRSVAYLLEQNAFTANVSELRLRDQSSAEIQAAVTKLETCLGEQTARLTEYELSLDNKYQEKIAKREQELAAKAKERDAVVAAMLKEREDQLAAREAALEEERKKFITQEPQYQRRSREEDFRKAVADGLTITPATTNKRWPIVIAIAASLIVSGLLILFFGLRVEESSKTQLNYVFLYELSASIFWFGSTMVFFFRWSNAWFQTHADMEFSNSRYKADMLRAAWIAEMVLTHETPQSVLDAMAKNLFLPTPKSREVAHPVDDLLQFTKNLSEIHAGTDGVTLKKTPKK